MLQDEQITRLNEKIEELTKMNKYCDRHRRREQRFLQTLIHYYKGDNVPLSDETCAKHCLQHNVKTRLCKELCASKTPAIGTRGPCHPEDKECVKNLRKRMRKYDYQYTTERPTYHTLSKRDLGRIPKQSGRRRWPYDYDYYDPDYVDTSRPLNVILSQDDAGEERDDYDFVIPEPIVPTKPIIPVEHQGLNYTVPVVGALKMRRELIEASSDLTTTPPCRDITCVSHAGFRASVCFQVYDPEYYHQEEFIGNATLGKAGLHFDTEFETLESNECHILSLTTNEDMLNELCYSSSNSVYSPCRLMSHNRLPLFPVFKANDDFESLWQHLNRS